MYIKIKLNEDGTWEDHGESFHEPKRSYRSRSRYRNNTCNCNSNNTGFKEWDEYHTVNYSKETDDKFLGWKT